MLRLLPRLLLALILLAAPLRATWSIVVYDTRTGEIVIASATCVDGSDLLTWTPVVIPGVGVAVTQAASPQVLKVIIHDGLLDGHPMERIKRRIENQFSVGEVNAMQYAIIDSRGRMLQHTGATNGRWAGGVTGQDGDLLYAIQGNVLAGAAVVDEAERALLQTQGDLGQRVMAAMESAMAMGGDGRCSCGQINPEGCGTPPPNFTQTATIGYFVISRPGDTRGACTSNGGCANGQYYLVLNEPDHQQPSTDPVILLRQRYDAWRLSQAARPDAFESLVVAPTQQVRAGDQALLDYWVELYDLDGQALTQGGAQFELVHFADSAGQAGLESVIDHQDGSYTLRVRTGMQAGRDRFAFQVDDGLGAVQLSPRQQLLHQSPPAPPMRELVPIQGPANLLHLEHAQVVADGAALWMAGDVGQGVELLRAPALLSGDFAAAVPVQLAGVPADRLASIFLSDDELYGVVSIREEDGVQRLYWIERPDTQSAFDTVDRLGTLNTDGEDGFAAVSPDRLRLYFQSRQSGEARLYFAERLDPEAEFFPGVALQTLPPSSGDGRPLILNDGALYAFHSSGSPRPRVQLARPGLAGEWSVVGPLAGAPGLDPQRGSLIGWSEASQQAWFVQPSMTGPQFLRAAWASGSFGIAEPSLSASQGGTLSLSLDAGPDFAAATYEVFAGRPGNGMSWNGLRLPLSEQIGLTGRVRALAGTPPLQDFVGQLDAQGQRQFQLQLVPGTHFQPGLIGQEFHFSFVATQQGRVFVSEADFLRLLD